MPRKATETIARVHDESGFKAESARNADDYDVLMCYQIFLGRNPESSSVIGYWKQQPIRDMVLGFLRSEEFADFAVHRVSLGTRVVYWGVGTVLTAEHISWLQSMVLLPEDQTAALTRATSWQEVFGILSAIDAFPKTDRDQPAAEPPVAVDGSGATPKPVDSEQVAELTERMRTIETLLRELAGQILSLRAESGYADGDVRRSRAVPLRRAATDTKRAQPRAAGQRAVAGRKDRTAERHPLS